MLDKSKEIEGAERDLFQNAILTLARFTALSVDRFHKTAELLLVKERRSTVNEADALVQMTKIFMNHLDTIANAYATALNDAAKTSDNEETVKSNVTTVFSEVSF